MSNQDFQIINFYTWGSDPTNMYKLRTFHNTVTYKRDNLIIKCHISLAAKFDIIKDDLFTLINNHIKYGYPITKILNTKVIL